MEIKNVKELKILKVVKHIHCPVNGWDCPL